GDSSSASMDSEASRASTMSMPSPRTTLSSVPQRGPASATPPRSAASPRRMARERERSSSEALVRRDTVARSPSRERRTRRLRAAASTSSTITSATKGATASIQGRSKKAVKFMATVLDGPATPSRTRISAWQIRAATRIVRCNERRNAHEAEHAPACQSARRSPADWQRLLRESTCLLWYALRLAAVPRQSAPVVFRNEGRTARGTPALVRTPHYPHRWYTRARRTPRPPAPPYADLWSRDCSRHR